MWRFCAEKLDTVSQRTPAPAGLKCQSSTGLLGLSGAFLIVLFSLEGKVDILAWFNLFYCCFVLPIVTAAVLLFNFQHVTLKEINSTFSFTRYLTELSLIKEGILFWFYIFMMSKICDHINQMMKVFCARYGGVYLMRFDWYWSSAPLGLLLMYKNVEDNSYFQKESWENVLKTCCPCKVDCGFTMLRSVHFIFLFQLL